MEEAKIHDIVLEMKDTPLPPPPPPETRVVEMPLKKMMMVPSEIQPQVNKFIATDMLKQKRP